MAVDHAKALEIVTRFGPVLPVKVAKALSLDIMMASAVLSKLVSEDKVFISKGKIGSSPLYYVKGQEPKLEILSQYMPGKIKEAYELIKKDKVIRDNSAVPWQRAALRELRDFAIPLNVELGSNVERFWKWYLISNDEASNCIKTILEKSEPIEPQEEIKEEKKKSVIEEPKVEKPKELLKEESKKAIEPVKKEEIKQEEKKETKKQAASLLLSRIYAYLQEKGIEIVKEEVTKKGKEADIIASIPSKIGNLRYYVKGIDKKTITEAELSLAHTKGQSKGMPILYLTTGKPTKKAQKYLEENSYITFHGL